jgi:hypothetical protein
MGAQTFQTSKSSLNILGPRRVIGSNFHAKDPQVLDAKVQNLVAQIPGELAPGIYLTGPTNGILHLPFA